MPANTGYLQENVRAMAAKPNGFVFAGTEFSGVLRSADNGESWVPVNNGLTSTGIACLVIDSGGDIFAGTFSGDRIFRSRDNGESWQPVNEGMFGPSVTALAISANGHLFAGTEWRGIFRSINNAQSWEQVYGHLTSVFIRSLTIGVNGHIFACTYNGDVIRSTDNGETWESLESGLESGTTQSLAASSKGYVFAGTSRHGVFRSVQPVNSVKGITSNAQLSFSLEQNFPNPLNPSASIRFELDAPSEISLKIYNLNGQLIKTILDHENKPAGSHTASIEMSGISGGVYLYVLESGSRRLTRKMVLIR